MLHTRLPLALPLSSLTRMQMPDRPMLQFQGTTILTRKDFSVFILIGLAVCHGVMC